MMTLIVGWKIIGTLAVLLLAVRCWASIMYFHVAAHRMATLNTAMFAILAIWL